MGGGSEGGGAAILREQAAAARCADGERGGVARTPARAEESIVRRGRRGRRSALLSSTSARAVHALAARGSSRGEDVAQRAHLLDRIRSPFVDARGDRRTRLARAANRARRLSPRGEEDLEALPVAG